MRYATSGAPRGRHAAHRFNYRPASDEVLEAYDRLASHAEATGTDLKAAALQFVLRHREVATLVVGASTPEEVEENLRLAYAPVPQSFWDGLE